MVCSPGRAAAATAVGGFAAADGANMPATWSGPPTQSTATTAARTTTTARSRITPASKCTACASGSGAGSGTHQLTDGHQALGVASLDRVELTRAGVQRDARLLGRLQKRIVVLRYLKHVGHDPVEAIVGRICVH